MSINSRLFPTKLTAAQLETLNRLADKLDMNKSDVVRLGLQFIAEANGEVWPDDLPGRGVRHDYLERTKSEK